MRGRKPKPTGRKILEGNPGKRALNPAEPQHPPPAETFDQPPPELAGDAVACAEWARLAPMLRIAKTVTEADRGALLALCQQWSRYLEATANVSRAGLVVKAPSGYPMVNPYVSIANKTLMNCTKLWVELGLTPSSRSRVVTTGPGPGGDAFSEFDIAPWQPTQH
jgi:P27 family predicted phage terminase small subunit